MEKNGQQELSKSIVQMMINLRQKRIEDGKIFNEETLNLQEKLIFCTINNYQSYPHSPENLEYFQKLVVSFLQKINKIVMENHQLPESNQTYKNPNKLINKAVGLLMTPQLAKYMGQLTTLGKLKILTFNNLACIYKKIKKYGIALRAVSFALQLEEFMLQNESNEQKYEIIPTYLNKAAIYSDMKKHKQSLQCIYAAQKRIEIIQNELMHQIEVTIQPAVKKRLTQKRYYGLYMKMIIYYNLGVQKEHLKLNTEAIQYYKQSKQLAIIIDNKMMTQKLTDIIDSLAQKNIL